MDKYEKIRGEWDNINSTTLWRIFSNELQSKLTLYQSKLTGDNKIGEAITRGESWQSIVQMLRSILGYPEKIVKDSKEEVMHGHAESDR